MATRGSEDGLDRTDDDVEAVRADQRVVGVMLVIHGVLHVVGFLLLWRIAAPRGFRYDDVWPAAGSAPAVVAGVVWLLAAAGLVVLGARLANRVGVSVPALLAVLALSVVLGVTALPAGLPVVVASGGVLLAVIVLMVRRRRHGISHPIRGAG